MLSLAFSNMVDVEESSRKNYRKPLLQRYVIRILLMYDHNPQRGLLSDQVLGFPSILPRPGPA